MLHTEVGEEAKKYISMRLVCVLFISLFIIVTGAAMAIGLYTLSSSKQSNLESQISAQQDNNTQLNNQSSILKIKFNASAAVNQDLKAKVDAAFKLNSQLNDTNISLTNQIISLTNQLQTVNSHFWQCVIDGGISLLANAAVIPFTWIISSNLATKKTQFNYFQPRYFLGISYTLESLINAKENSKSLNFQLLYNSTNNFDKDKFKANVSTKNNTVTLIETSKNELIAFILFAQWDFSKQEIDDPRAFTISFRQYNRTLKSQGTALYPNNEFFSIGMNEIVLFNNASGIAQGGPVFVIPSGQNNKTFYTEDGSFSLLTFQVYQFY